MTGQRRIAGILTFAIVALIVVASSWGLLVPHTYHEGPWGAGALRGGDLVSLVLAAPLLVAGATAGLRGWRAGAVVWCGALAYCVYNYAYYVFGADFDDVFLLHILVLAGSGWTLVLLLPVTRAGLGPVSLHGRQRWVVVLLGAVALVLGVLWGSAIVRQALTGHLPAGTAPVSGLHTVYAVDLTLFVSSLVVATVLGWRGTGYGLIAVAVMSVAGTTYLVNLMAAAAYQAAAGVDVAPFSLGTLGLTLVFAAASVSTVRRLHQVAPRLEDAPAPPRRTGSSFART